MLLRVREAMTKEVLNASEMCGDDVGKFIVSE